MSVFKQKASSFSGGSELPPAGNHPAVLVGIIDLGTHQESYQNGPPEPKHSIYLAWELTSEKMSGTKDRNHVIGRKYSLSFNQKSNMRGLIEKWRGTAFTVDEEFDLAQLAGKACMVSVVHKPSGDRTYANVEGVAKVPKGLPVPPAQNKPIVFEIDGEQEIPDAEWLPWLYGEQLKDVIARSQEWKEHLGRAMSREPQTAGVGAAHTNDDNEPF